MDINWPTLVLQTFGFFLLMGVLTKFLYRPVLELLEKRSRETQRFLDLADEKCREAENSIHKAKQELNEAKEDALSLRNDSRNFAYKERDAMIEKTKEEAEHLIKHAKEEIDCNVKKAKHELKAEVVDISLAISEKMLMREITQEDRKRYINLYREELEQSNES
jgi:F-type H+-transporting ATPase subunit b